VPLAAEAWRFLTATSVDELWMLLEAEDPSVVLLALAVDGIPSRTLCAEIRARSHRHRLAIVGLLEIDDSEYADALLSGFDVCLTASMGIEALRSQLRAVVPIVAAGRQMSGRRGMPYSGPWRRRTDGDQRRTTQ
jgi:DNA-binding response OmpR family regulator